MALEEELGWTEAGIVLPRCDLSQLHKAYWPKDFDLSVRDQHEDATECANRVLNLVGSLGIYLTSVRRGAAYLLTDHFLVTLLPPPHKQPLATISLRFHLFYKVHVAINGAKLLYTSVALRTIVTVNDTEGRRETLSGPSLVITLSPRHPVYDLVTITVAAPMGLEDNLAL